MKKFSITILTIILVIFLGCTSSAKPNSKSFCGDARIFSSGTNDELANEVAKLLGQDLGKVNITKFKDGEISLSLEESVRGKDCIIIQSIEKPVNDNLVKYLLLADTMKRNGARTITAVIPYMGYSRQDRMIKYGDPISAKMVAGLISKTGTDRVITIDLHSMQIEGFFDIPIENVEGQTIFVPYFKEIIKDNIDDFVVVSPDVGGISRARKLAKQLGLDLAIVDKHRPQANVSEVKSIIGNVKGKKVILVDDMIDTAGSITNAAKAVKEYGALEVYACATHAVLSGPAIDRITNSPIRQVILLDTINISKELPENFLVLSTSEKIADVLSKLFS